MWDITQLFELWNCSKAKSMSLNNIAPVTWLIAFLVKNPDCLAFMWTECSATINGTLSKPDTILGIYMDLSHILPRDHLMNTQSCDELHKL